MSMRFLHTDDAPAAVGPYSQGIEASGTIYLSGQLGLVPSTGALAATFEDQARQALRNMSAILSSAGLANSDVLSVDVFLTDLVQFAVFNKLYEEHFAEHKPARAVIGVSALPLGGQVEVRCLARRPGIKV